MPSTSSGLKSFRSWLRLDPSLTPALQGTAAPSCGTLCSQVSFCLPLPFPSPVFWVSFRNVLSNGILETFLTVPISYLFGIQEPWSPTRDRTCVSCIGSTTSWPLDQGSAPAMMFWHLFIYPRKEEDLHSEAVSFPISFAIS